MIALGMEPFAEIAYQECAIPINASLSVMVAPTAYIPGLNGRLNAICDRQNRRYLCADKIAANGDQAQPMPFDVSRLFEVEDAQGLKFEMSVKVISGRTSLLEYRRLA